MARNFKEFLKAVRTMALQIKYKKEVFGQEILFEKAYVEITFISGDKYNLDIYVTIYNNQSKQDVLDKTSYRFSLDITDNGLNPYKQGYNYMKTLEEYKDAIDVLEEGQTVA
jgi:hypothetical protein